MLQFLKYLLFPFSLIYKGITSFRNLLFDFGILPSFQPPLPTIGVGNLTVGGTGKTPIIDYLISILISKKLGVISRGYGRKTKGFLQIEVTSISKEVGDEPFMLFTKNPSVTFFVSESRVEGFQKALKIRPDLEIVLFDDIFQHRYIKPALNILLCDYQRPFYDDFVLPSGLLRESRTGARRGDIVIVTKCPENISGKTKLSIRNKIKKYCESSTPIYFSYFKTLKPQNSKKEILKNNSEIVLISGLANNLGFRNSLESNFTVLKHFCFRDHHDFSRAEIEQIVTAYPNTKFVCTEKDVVKIESLLNNQSLGNFYVCGQKVVLFEEESFKKLILERVAFI